MKKVRAPENWFVVRMEDDYPMEVIKWNDWEPEGDSIAYELVIARDELEAYIKALRGEFRK